MSCREQAQAYFLTNPLQYLVQMKYLSLYREVMRCERFVNNESGMQSLITHAVADHVRDNDWYAGMGIVYIPAATTNTAAHELAQYMHQQCEAGAPVILKISDSYCREVFADYFSMQRARAFLTFTAPDNFVFQPTTDVVVGDSICDVPQGFYDPDSYAVKLMPKIFANEARIFGKWVDDSAVCVCIAYKSHNHIWEIGFLETAEALRRRGYGREVVSAAVAYLLEQDKIPRYQVEESNVPSVRLAQSIGLKLCLTVEHYRAIPLTTPEHPL